MAELLRIGVAGLTHGHAGGIIPSFLKESSVQLVALAEPLDIAPHLKENFPRQYSNYKEMLAKESLDGLIVTSNNRESSQIAVDALNAGISVFVEKPMAATGADAQRMLEAMTKSGKTLMINWPFAWEAWLHDMVHRANAGEVGKVFHFKFRSGHSGPKEIGCESYFVDWLHNESLNGGGAIADFGSYGAVLSRWMMGMPETVYCVKGNQTKSYYVPDDHAMILLKYPHATAVLEATWATVNFGAYPTVSVFGDTGTLTEEGGRVRKYSSQGSDLIDSAPLAHVNCAEGFIHALRTGETPAGMLDPRISADASKIIDAAIRSNRSGKAESPD